MLYYGVQKVVMCSELITKIEWYEIVLRIIQKTHFAKQTKEKIKS